MKLRNKYYMMRHGQALSNVKAVCSPWPEKFHNPLTKEGKEVVKNSVQNLSDKITKKGKKIDLIFASPLLRTQQTAKIAEKILKANLKTDKRLREVGFGIFNARPLVGMWKFFKSEEERINKKPEKGENYRECLVRVLDFLKAIDKKYKGKNILIISHECPLFLLHGKFVGLSIKETIQTFPLDKRIHKGEIRELN